MSKSDGAAPLEPSAALSGVHHEGLAPYLDIGEMGMAVDNEAVVPARSLKRKPRKH